MPVFASVVKEYVGEPTPPAGPHIGKVVVTTVGDNVQISEPPDEKLAVSAPELNQPVFGSEIHE